MRREKMHALPGNPRANVKITMNASQQSSIVITGGQGDLAKAIQERFDRGKWVINAPGRSELDVTDQDLVFKYFSHHPTDLLICNAGAIHDATLAKLTEGDWEYLIDVNFHGARRCAIAALEWMQKRKSGHIIFISSNSAIHPPVGQSAYAASKAALLGLTRDLAILVGPRGIRVNAILPGFLETKMTAVVSNSRREAVRASHALGRFNTPNSVASFIWHLHNDLPHTSGQIFRLDSRVS